VRSDGAVLTVDVERGGVQDALERPAQTPGRLVFTPDGLGLVGLANGALMRWHLPTGALVTQEVPGLANHSTNPADCRPVRDPGHTWTVMSIAEPRALWRSEPIAPLATHGATLAEGCEVLALFGPQGGVQGLRDPVRGPSWLLLALPDGDWAVLGSDGSVRGRDRVGRLARRWLDGRVEPALPGGETLPPLPTAGMPLRTPETVHGCASCGRLVGIAASLGALAGLGRRKRTGGALSG
jgi:hypothetical protein